MTAPTPYDTGTEPSETVGGAIEHKDGRRIIYATYRGDIRTFHGRPRRTFGYREAIHRADQPGDIVQFLPNKYWSPYKPMTCTDAVVEPEPIEIIGLRGEPDRPVTLRGLGSQTILCGHNAAVPIYPDLPERSHFAFFKIIDCEWLVIEDFQVESCWPCFAYIEDSRYLTFRKITAVDSVYLIFARGRNSHHVLIEDNDWEQDPSRAIWTDMFWSDVHGWGNNQGRYRYLNGGLFGSKGIAGDVVFRRNSIRYAYNGLRMCAEPGPDADWQNLNVEICGNRFEYIRDNAVEPEHSAINWHIYHNRMHNNYAPLSFDTVGGGFWYIYGNLGWFTGKPGQAADTYTVGKWIKFIDSPPYPDKPVFVFNNSWFLRVPVVKSGETRNFNHLNNAVEFCTAGDDGDGLCESGRGLVSSGFMKNGWHPSVTFDYDLTNRPIPKPLTDNGQEAHGRHDPLFQFENPAGGVLECAAGYCPPKSCEIVLRSGLDWTGEYDWSLSAACAGLPLVGACQEDGLTQGPPLVCCPRISGDARSQDAPRIVRTDRKQANKISVHFSAPLLETEAEVILKAPDTTSRGVTLKAVIEGTILTVAWDETAKGLSPETAVVRLPGRLTGRESGTRVTFWACPDPCILPEHPFFWHEN